MASGPAVQPALLERGDIHKSCKSIETLVKAFNDYCEALSSIVSSQKKLAKSLRETAGMKATGEIAANALNTGASIFEIMSEINIKFSNIADREFDNINSEVKKWFRKLAKEEKAHDERMNTINTRIKQAGHVYETKSNQTARDAGEEHARYVNLVSTLGPEISQDKHNHALLVTQKHASTTASVAACLARIADTEWLRSCEEVRRFAPKVGQLGVWRALCEGGWTGALPQELPSLDENQEQLSGPQLSSNRLPMQTLERQDSRDGRGTMGQLGNHDERSRVKNIHAARTGLPFRATSPTSGEPFLSRKPSFATFASSQQFNSASTNKPNLYLHPAKPFSAASNNWTDTVGSVTSLSSFPSPPVHVPVSENSVESDRPGPQSHTIPTPLQLSSSSPSPNLPPLSEALGLCTAEMASTDSLVAAGRPKSPRTPRDDQATMPFTVSMALSTGREKGTMAPALGTNDSSSHAFVKSNPSVNDLRTLTLTRNQSLHARGTPQIIEKSSWSSNPSSARTSGSVASKQDAVDELGVEKTSGPSESKDLDAVKTHGLVGRGSAATASGAISPVAAVHSGSRHTHTITSPSTNVPNNVNEMVPRYQLVDGHSSPRRLAPSPTGERLPQSPIEVVSPRPRISQFGYGKMEFPSPSMEANTGELTFPRQEVGEQDVREQVHRDGQHEIEMSIPKLEEDHTQSCISRDSHSSEKLNDDAEASSHVDFHVNSSTPILSRMRYSSSTTQLLSPSSPPLPPSSFTHHQHSQSQSSSTADLSPSLNHATFCGCPTCSVSKSRVRSTTLTYDRRRPETPITLRPEKRKGWISRITVPVGNAFSSDSKKSSPALKEDVMFSAGAAGEGKIRRSFEQLNRSLTTLTKR